ncbi:MAG: glycogen/starch synthase, partial [Lachnospiraceae bacterium]|nr:glycogen/starch synthase [Lachnospiraceae bacterium]
MKKVMFATSEAVPYVKTGGLADVTGSLPKYFDKKTFDVRVILPKYMCILQEKKQEMEYLFDFTISLGWREQYVGIWKAENDGITYYFIDNEFYFGG